MDTELLKGKKNVLSNDKLVVEGKEFMPTDLKVKHHPHAYDVEKIDRDNDIPKIYQTNHVLEKREHVHLLLSKEPHILSCN